MGNTESAICTENEDRALNVALFEEGGGEIVLQTTPGDGAAHPWLGLVRVPGLTNTSEPALVDALYAHLQTLLAKEAADAAAECSAGAAR